MPSRTWPVQSPLPLCARAHGLGYESEVVCCPSEARPFLRVQRRVGQYRLRLCPTWQPLGVQCVCVASCGCVSQRLCSTTRHVCLSPLCSGSNFMRGMLVMPGVVLRSCSAAICGVLAVVVVVPRRLGHARFWGGWQVARRTTLTSGLSLLGGALARCTSLLVEVLLFSILSWRFVAVVFGRRLARFLGSGISSEGLLV